MRFSVELARTVFDSLSAHIAILDETGTIIETNITWQEYGRQNGMPESYEHRGISYLKICEAADQGNVAAGIRAVIQGKIQEFVYDYPCHSPDSQHWYYMRAIRMKGGEPVRIVVSHEDITALKLTEKALKESQEALLAQKQSLEETNIALKVLLQQREEDKTELEKKVLVNTKDLILPYVLKLKKSRLKQREKTTVDIIETHLNDIISPLLLNLSNANILLTPQETQVASLIKDGKTSKEISDILSVSVTTVNFHRKNLRLKLGLANRKTNLRSYLLSIS